MRISRRFASHSSSSRCWIQAPDFETVRLPAKEGPRHGLVLRPHAFGQEFHDVHTASVRAVLARQPVPAAGVASCRRSAPPGFPRPRDPRSGRIPRARSRRSQVRPVGKMNVAAQAGNRDVLADMQAAQVGPLTGFALGSLGSLSGSCSGLVMSAAPWRVAVQGGSVSIWVRDPVSHHHVNGGLRFR